MKLINTGDETGDLLRIETVLRHGQLVLGAPLLMAGIREIASQWGQVLPCPIVPHKTYVIEFPECNLHATTSGGSIGPYSTQMALKIGRAVPFTIDCKLVFSNAKTQRIRIAS